MLVCWFSWPLTLSSDSVPTSMRLWTAINRTVKREKLVVMKLNWMLSNVSNVTTAPRVMSLSRQLFGILQPWSTILHVFCAQERFFLFVWNNLRISWIWLVFFVGRILVTRKMDYSKVQLRAQRAMSDRMLERYPMSNSDLFSTDDSSEGDLSELIYRNLRFKSPMDLPFRIDNSIDGSVPIVQPANRPHSVNACAKCNAIRTNPRFRPSSFYFYGKPLNERNVCVDSDDSSENEIQVPKRKSFSNKRRRNRLKHSLR